MHILSKSRRLQIENLNALYRLTGFSLVRDDKEVSGENVAECQTSLTFCTMRNIHLIELFNETASRFPNKPALIDDEIVLSFKELQNQAWTIAWHIEALGTGNNQPVAILLGDSWQAIAAILGTLYSGNCYAPMDTKNPADRMQKILGNLNPVCIITDTAGAKSLADSGNRIEVMNVDEIDLHLQVPEPFGYKDCIDTDPAYIIHTSGSTGIPKGVAISHLSVMDYIGWAMETFDISEDEIIGNQAPLVFDNSTLDLYLMVFAGATLCLIPKHLFMFPARLMDYINEKGINFVFWVPSVLVNVANLQILDNLDVPGLQKVLFAGEVMPTKPLNYWRHHLGSEVLFANLYGPTEITVDCTYHILEREYDDNEVLPIGKPCRNSDVLILNERGQVCKENEPGELCVRGSSLALGYWNNPEKTEAAFVQNPLNPHYPEKIYRTGDLVYSDENGEIIFVGRMDNQIKHLGYRIELGEIEHAVSTLFDNLHPCVIYDETNKKIVLIYESASEISAREFRRALSKVLSKYMIPSEFIHVKNLQYNTSGKIDRKFLKEQYLHAVIH